MANPALWAHEARRGGPAAVGAPLAVAGGLSAWSFATASHAVPLAVPAAQAILALTAGLVGVSAVIRESILELQLTLPTSYPAAVLRRLLPSAVAALGGGTLALVPLTAGQPHISFIAALGGLWAFAGLSIAVGLWACAVTGSAAGGSGAVLAVWVAKVFFLDRLLGPPAVQAALLTGLAVAVLAAAIRRLRDAERLMETEKRRE